MIGKSTYETQSCRRKTPHRYRADDLEVMQTGRAKLNYEESLIKPDGSQGWVITSKVPMFDRDGRVIGLLGTYEDITERKRAEIALRESEECCRSVIENMSGRFLPDR